MKPTPSRLALALAGAAALVSLTACSGTGPDGPDGPDGTGGSGRSDARPRSASGAEQPAASPAPELADSLSKVDDGTSGKRAPDPTSPAVISTGTVSLEADDVARTRLEVRKIVDRFRGTVSEQETTTGERGEVASARLVLRVPSARFDEVVGALEEVATLTDSSTTSEDVSAEVVDVAARIRAQRKSVERIEALLARAETIEQVVAVESQLARRQADLDALVSRQKWLADQTGMSTISVYVERPPAKRDRDHDDAGGFVGGLERGWDSFVDGLGTVAVVLGFAIPWLAVLTLIGVPLSWVLRRRLARRPAPSTTPTPSATS